MHKRAFGLLPLAMILLLAGCNQDQNILERIGYIRIGAFDPAEGEKIRLTINVPLTINEGQNARRLTEVLTTEARGSKEARNMLQNQSSRKLVSGQLRTILFNRELAVKGLTPYLDTLIRDPSISKRAEMVIADGSAQEMISKDYSGHPGADRYIDQLLRKEFEMQHVPHILLHQFIRDYYDDGKDPMAPLLSPKDASLELSGIALFHYDKYAGKVERAEFPYFTMLYQNQNKGEFTINTDDPSLKSITFSAIKSKRKIKVKKIREGKYAADINIWIEGGVLEYIGNLDLTKSDRKKLERLIGEYVTKRTEQILAKLQRYRTDPVGIGQHVRNSMAYSVWKESDWSDLYANMEFRVHTRFIIKNFGNRYD